MEDTKDLPTPNDQHVVDDYHEDHEDDEDHEDGDRQRRPRRRPRSNRREPAVYVGNIPRGTRVSEFKQEVRGRDVAPIRVMWRGANRHAFLFFEEEDDIEDAIAKLEAFEISGKPLKVERSAEQKEGEDNRRERRDRGERGDRGDRNDRGDDGRPSRGRGPRSQGGRNQASPRRMRPGGNRAPTVYIGGIPKGTRVSDLKSLVRAQGVEPLRVLWRGGAGHTFLFFEQEDDAENAVSKLHDLEVNGKSVRVERGGRRPSESQDEERSRDSSTENVTNNNAKGGTPSPRQRRQGNNRRRERNNSRTTERSPAVYIGGIPRGTRAGEFKTQVREKDLAPFRLIWRLSAGHAYLLFQAESEVDDALHKLADLEVNGKLVRVERSNREENPKTDHSEGEGEDEAYDRDTST